MKTINPKVGLPSHPTTVTHTAKQVGKSAGASPSGFHGTSTKNTTHRWSQGGARPGSEVKGFSGSGTKGGKVSV